MSGLRPGKALKVTDDGKPKLIARTRASKSGRNVIKETPIAPVSHPTPSSSSRVTPNPGSQLDPVVASVFGQPLQPSWADYDDAPQIKSKTQNDYLCEFESCKRAFVHALLDRYAGPVHSECISCTGDQVGRAVFRCRTCFDMPAMCRRCMRQKHYDTPYHRIDKWNGRFYQRAALWQVGLHLVISSRTCEIDCIRTRVDTIERDELVRDVEAGLRLRRPAASADNIGAGDTFPNPLPAGDYVRPEGHVEYVDNELGANDEEPEAEYPQDDFDDPGDDDVLEEDAGDSLGHGIPRLSVSGNAFITVVDASGIHHLPMIECRCSGEEQIVLDCVASGLIPTSYKKVATVFTEQCLDEARLANLEAKTTPYQYFNYLRRLTNPAFPSAVPNRYAELPKLSRRLTREWRIMKREMWAATHMGHPGQEHDAGAAAANMPITGSMGSGTAAGLHSGPSPNTVPGLNSVTLDSTGTGKISLFCPACPQPGVNMPDGWDKLPDREKFMNDALLTTDANFTADHIRQKKSYDDVDLLRGRGMFTPKEPYETVCRITNARKEKKTTEKEEACGNTFRAITHASRSRLDCDVTGIGAVACARNGFFVPGSVVNLQFGERHVNMDWSIVEALKYCGIGINGKARVWYDIFCQWYIHFLERVNESGGILVLPFGLILIGGIGLFHVHGHEEKCFRRYASYFIPGSAIVDGEVLETLWSVLNLVSRSTRTATLAHREEVIDDHMNDSNWKKLVGIVQRLMKKFKTASKQQAETTEYWANMTETTPKELVPVWTAEIQLAEDCRETTKGLSMDYLMARNAKPVETQAGAHVRMIEKYPEHAEGAAYIAEALKLEIEQMKLAIHIARFGRNPSKNDKIDIAKLRTAMMNRLGKLHDRTSDILGPRAASKFPVERPPIPVFTVEQHDGVYVVNDNAGDDPAGPRPETLPAFSLPSAANTPAERVLVQLPSALPTIWTTTGQESAPLTGLDWASAARVSPNLPQLIQIEWAMREGLVNDTLHDIRVAISSLSFQYTDVYCRQSTQAPKTRSRSAIDNLAKGISHSRRVYDLNRQRLAVLGNTSLRVITNDDVRVSTAIRQPNQPGQVRKKLSWIFRIQMFGDSEQDEVAVMSEYFRIHWLYARAMKMRWDEEVILVPHEMRRTTIYFRRKSEEWRKVAEYARSKERFGQAAYAAKQEALWWQLATHAFSEFSSIQPQLPNDLNVVE